MGKLRDLKDQWEMMDWDDPKRQEVEKEINRIEQWCIDNGNMGGITKLTVFNGSASGTSNQYPWHTGYVDFRDIGMVAELNGKGIHYNKDKSVHHCEICPKL